MILPLAKVQSHVSKCLGIVTQKRGVDMWMACYTQEEIADKVGIGRKTVDERLEVLADLEALPKAPKLSALYQDAENLLTSLSILNTSG